MNRKYSMWTVLWIVSGILSTVLAFVNPYIGWFAAGNLAVLVSGVYLMKEAWARTDRLLDNKKLLKKMSRDQKDKFVALDRQESKNIQVMCNMMMPLITICNACLNIYCTVYYKGADRLVSAFDAGLKANNTALIAILIADVVFAGLFYFFLRKDIHMIMELPEKTAAAMKENRQSAKSGKK